MFEFTIGFIFGVGAGLVYSIFKPLKWARAQDEIRDKLE